MIFKLKIIFTLELKINLIFNFRFDKQFCLTISRRIFIFHPQIHGKISFSLCSSKNIIEINKNKARWSMEKYFASRNNITLYAKLSKAFLATKHEKSFPRDLNENDGGPITMKKNCRKGWENVYKIENKKIRLTEWKEN